MLCGLELYTRKIKQGGAMSQTLTKAIEKNKTAVKIFGILSFSFLTAVGAQIYIPLPWTPVPITMQTFFVLLSGVVLGGIPAGISQITYTIFGVLGLPFFTRGISGIARITGPTGGYILGFILSSFFVGKLSRKTNSILILFLGMIIYLFLGSLQLMFVMNYTPVEAFYKGFAPFIIGDTIKILAIAGINLKFQKLWRIFD